MPDLRLPEVADHPTLLWKLERESRIIECRVRLVPYGIEIDIARDGVVILTRAFDGERDALEWAERKRAARITEGWTVVEDEGVKPIAN
jgi:hypothetical protein